MNRITTAVAACAFVTAASIMNPAGAAILDLSRITGPIIEKITPTFLQEVRGLRLFRAPVRSTPRTANSSGANSTSRNTNNKDADFSSSNAAGASRGNYGANFGGKGSSAAAASGAAYQGSPFLSSMTGTMAGMMLYNMMFPRPAQAGEIQKNITPDTISDADLESCLKEIELQKEKLIGYKNDKLASGSVSDEDIKQIDDDMARLTDMELVLVKEQVRRLKGAS